MAIRRKIRRRPRRIDRSNKVKLVLYINKDWEKDVHLIKTSIEYNYPHEVDNIVAIGVNIVKRCKCGRTLAPCKCK